MVSCPFLPEPERDFKAADINAHGSNRDLAFYADALNYAQTLWLTGFPAKALLLINRALSCSLPDVSLRVPYQPYDAIAWILVNRPEDRFIGNPRRHYQHLATRMVEPHKELRTWRAWACWHLSKNLLREDEFPHDAKQVREERIAKPRRHDIAAQLDALSPCDDRISWEHALEWAHPFMVQPPARALGAVHIRIIGPDERDTVRGLAEEIWPKVYPSVISPAQIRYMLDDRYDTDVLRQEMVVRGITYALIEHEGNAVGYIAYEPNPGDNSLFLHKLYLKPELHGRGLGAKALQWVEQQARAADHGYIRLRVNRNNHAAIRAYLREGFVFEHDLCSDIGNGFVMDDHVMGKPVTRTQEA
jgi:GNAT superfamily N-acetyltransferase